ncbi:MAG: (2Fe-2S)-binding protein [Candidatus Omnitrophica bacterium]|nr:(2Fe-2S)-binding protein [Candidatus Omnitrophota bacterium]
MSEYVTLTINGAKVRAPRGTSVLDAALDYGICIPHLCHMQGVIPTGVCRLCIVEVIEKGRSKVTTSCTLEAEEGMVILAHTDKILKARKNIAEMLVAEAPNSRAIQDIALKCGVKDVRYPFRNKDCVLCGRCVRACTEIWRSRSLGFVGRGEQRHVALPFDERPEFCKRCNACIDLCPMTITPCDGPMKKGEEYFCGKCESQLSMSEDFVDSCVWCRLGEGFDVTGRHAGRKQEDKR